MDVRVRFFEKVRYRADGCWEWMGARVGSGYGNFVEDGRRSSRRYTPAHRFAYEVLIGPIPDGFQLDHLCRHRWCVNPEHLEPVTNQENSQRGLKGRLVMTCVHGHPYTSDNTVYRRNGRRACRQCRLDTSRRANERRATTCADCGITISHGRIRCRHHAQRHRRLVAAAAGSAK